MNAIIVFSINLILYLGLFFFYLRKRSFDLYFIILGFYVLLALSSFICVFDSDPDDELPNNFHILTLIYLFLSVVFLLIPARRYCQWGHHAISETKPWKIKMIIGFIVVSTILRVPDIITNSSEIIENALFDSAAFFNAYNDNMEVYTEVQKKGSFNMLTIILTSFDKYIPFFLMYYLTFSNRKKWVVSCLFLSVLIGPINGLGNVQRGVMLGTLLSFVVAYFMFKRYLSLEMTKLMRWSGLFFVGLIIIMISAITISRFSQDYMEEGSTMRSIYAYAGQPMHRFSAYGFDPGQIRYGDRTIPLLKTVLGMDCAYDYAHRMALYQKLNMPESLFCTFVGDFVSDYGAVVTTIILFFIYVVFSNMVGFKKGIMSLDRLLALYILSYMIICGWNLYPFADYGGNLHLFIGIALYFFFKVDKKQVYNNKAYPLNTK